MTSKEPKRDFQYYLSQTKEVGYVEQVFSSLVYASGLPSVRPSELVMFENGEIGQVWSISSEYVEILLLSANPVRTDARIARTGKIFEIPVGDFLLNKLHDPLCNFMLQGNFEYRPIEVAPKSISERDLVRKPFETGVGIVDLVVPLARGQRELIIGDRKTGKTTFALQTVLSFSRQAEGVSIYCVIGKTRVEIKRIYDFFVSHKVSSKVVMIASTLSQAPALSYIAPYTAMTIAEYFRDKGKDVLIVFDDLTIHAKVYRELALISRRFPGRNSYPGDVFYIHSKLLERAGKFKKGSITALPIAESILSDLSGYIQTNLMAITDGHILFDAELFNEGKRPPVNPYLSVTRVGEQAQDNLVRDASRTLIRFLIRYRRLSELTHFGADFQERAFEDLSLGAQIQVLFQQKPEITVPIQATMLLLGGIWARIWKDLSDSDLRSKIDGIIDLYRMDPDYRQKVNGLVLSHESFANLVADVKSNQELLFSE
jgi:F-type H+-transporting ATPase subunit alpha